VLQAVVHEANIQDRRGALRVLTPNLARKYPLLRTVFADQGYTGDVRQTINNETGIMLDIVKRPGRWVWCQADEEPPPAPVRFQVLKKRWIVERTFAWLGRYRRLARDYEQIPGVSEAFIHIAMTHLMLNRLAKSLV